MSYSDEPQMISENRRSPKRWVLIGLVGVLLATLAMVALYPRYFEYRRRHADVGPHGGTLYSVSLEGEKFSLELARTEEMDVRLQVYLTPKTEGEAWLPEDYIVRERHVADEEVEWELLAWSPELDLFGPSEMQYHPGGDYRFELEILRDGERVWKGHRWSYRPSQGHAH